MSEDEGMKVENITHDELKDYEEFLSSKENLFCDPVCSHLTPFEYNQKKGEDHRCLKFNKKLYHGSCHPNIIKCEECLKTMKDFNEVKLGIPWKDKD